MAFIAVFIAFLSLAAITQPSNTHNSHNTVLPNQTSAQTSGNQDDSNYSVPDAD